MKSGPLSSFLVLAGLALAGAPSWAAGGAQTAADFGCLNCHSAQARSAPPLKRLADRVGRGGDSPQALQHMLREMREQDTVHTHGMVSDEAALVVLQWLAQGAK
jgi:cytochrome c551/c552